MTVPADVELLESMRAGDEQAFTLLFRAHWKPLYKLALTKTGDSEAAHDMVQELFVTLWEDRNTLTINGPLLNYLYGMLRHRVLDYFRLSKKQEYQLEQLSLYLPDTQAEAAPAEALHERGQKEQRFDEAVDSLPERIKEVYMLRCHNQHSFETIATIMGIRPQTARNAYLRAKELLKQHAASFTISFLAVWLNNLFI